MTHSQTGEVMVLKELYRVDEQAQKNFLKEVKNTFLLLKAVHVILILCYVLRIHIVLMYSYVFN